MSFLQSKVSCENPAFRLNELPDNLTSSQHCSECGQISLSTPSSYQSEPKFMLQWKDIRVAVPIPQGQRMVLDGVSGEIDNQHITAILGCSGAGKSTLLNCIAGTVNQNWIS